MCLEGEVRETLTASTMQPPASEPKASCAERLPASIPPAAGATVVAGPLSGGGRSAASLGMSGAALACWTDAGDRLACWPGWAGSDDAREDSPGQLPIAADEGTWGDPAGEECKILPRPPAATAAIARAFSLCVNGRAPLM